MIYTGKGCRGINVAFTAMVAGEKSRPCTHKRQRS
jgi:hypothetical protein